MPHGRRRDRPDPDRRLQIVCTLNEKGVPERAAAEETTRSAAQVALWRPMLEGAVIAIGNAPTALFRLMEEIEAGVLKPAVILGFPVGFVGAAESKDALAETDLPFVTLLGAARDRGSGRQRPATPLSG